MLPACSNSSGLLLHPRTPPLAAPPPTIYRAGPVHLESISLLRRSSCRASRSLNRARKDTVDSAAPRQGLLAAGVLSGAGCALALVTLSHADVLLDRKMMPQSRTDPHSELVTMLCVYRDQNSNIILDTECPPR
ncbi:hypothetical protein WJX73_006077 [Symbiochloris irregularis]|uniref:Uncharacterized protein n=1 Tax=Symbiochloris irregularis TaxID=706552 RepID=A0AAW1NTZ7_9CHLO